MLDASSTGVLSFRAALNPPPELVAVRLTAFPGMAAQYGVNASGRAFVEGVSA